MADTPSPKPVPVKARKATPRPRVAPVSPPKTVSVPAKADPAPLPPVVEAAVPPVVEPVKDSVPEPVLAAVSAINETAENLSERVAEPVPTPSEGTNTMTDFNAQNFQAQAKDRVQAIFGDFNEKAKSAVEKGGKVFEEFNDIAKGNVEALVESGRIAAKGAETFGQGAAEFGRKNFEKATATFKSFASVKTPAEFLQLHSEYLSSSFDSLASESAKASEAMLKLAGDIVQPLSSRVAVVTDKIKTIAN